MRRKMTAGCKTLRKKCINKFDTKRSESEFLIKLNLGYLLKLKKQSVQASTVVPRQASNLNLCGASIERSELVIISVYQFTLNKICHMDRKEANWQHRARTEAGKIAQLRIAATTRGGFFF